MHILVEVSSRFYSTQAVQILKRLSVREVFKKFPKLKKQLWAEGLWRDGYFVFESQSLGDILKKISRHYNVSIQVNDQKLENETFSGCLDLRNSASQVLEIIAEIINVKVENIDSHILIKR